MTSCGGDVTAPAAADVVMVSNDWSESDRSSSDALHAVTSSARSRELFSSKATYATQPM